MHERQAMWRGVERQEARSLSRRSTESRLCWVSDDGLRVPETSEQGRRPGRAQSLINADLMHSLPRWGLALYPSGGIIPNWWMLETDGQSLCRSRNTKTCKGRGPRPGVELSVLAPTSLPGPPRIPLG